MAKSKKSPKKIKTVEELEFPELVDIVRRRGKADKQKMNTAYNEIEKRMKKVIDSLLSKFNIPGLEKHDIRQEILYALRYKAIPDFKDVIGRNGKPYPFNNFATKCIRRHLCTLLKTCSQDKRKALNTSLSLDQDRNDSSDESLFLADVIPRTSGDLLSLVSEKEYHNTLFSKLYERLSKFEKTVFMFYARKCSYEEITKLINKMYIKKKSKKRINVKSVDNALSRMKQKAKEIFDKYGEED